MTTGIPCKHLESLMPRNKGNRSKRNLVRIRDLNWISYKHYNSPYSLIDDEQSEEKIGEFLRSIGLLEWRIKLIVDRFIHCKTYKEIAIEGGYRGVSSVHFFIKQTLENIKGQLQNGKT